MSFLIPCFHAFCFSSVPKSTETDYYFDPKILTSGKPNFETDMVKYQISEQEFFQMRKAMLEVGDPNLKAMKITFILMVIHAILCFMVAAGIGIFALCFSAKIAQLFFPSLGLIASFVVPNLVLQWYWKYAMGKACKIIEKLFESQNDIVYSLKGISWILTHGNLKYIHIKNVEAELRSFRGYSLENKTKVFEANQSRITTALETARSTNSNIEFLLKHM